MKIKLDLVLILVALKVLVVQLSWSQFYSLASILALTSLAECLHQCKVINLRLSMINN